MAKSLQQARQELIEEMVDAYRHGETEKAEGIERSLLISNDPEYIASLPERIERILSEKPADPRRAPDHFLSGDNDVVTNVYHEPRFAPISKATIIFWVAIVVIVLSLIFGK